MRARTGGARGLIRAGGVAAVLGAGLASGLGAQDQHVHGGHAACYEPADWLTQERAYLAGDVSGWNRIMRPFVEAGRCWLTTDGGDYELAASEVSATVLIRPRVQAKQEAPRWSVVSVRAVSEP